MISFPNAKINLGLQVVEKRSDGFHNIESVFYPVGLCDVLEVVESKNSGADLTITGIDIPGDKNENLCLKAYRLLSQDHSLPGIEIHLHKVIPTGAGLGGGSSDAAFFIKLLNQKFELNISWGEMHHYAKQLGSDCSFFVTNRTAFVEGRGDSSEPISVDLNKYHIGIVHPGIHIETKVAYEGIIPKKPEHSLEKNILELPLAEWKDKIKNDFEEPLFLKYPLIEKIKKELYSHGAIYASMSGSGSAVFGIFEEKIDLAIKFPDFFSWIA